MYCAQTLGRIVVATMHAKLPRELCCMVYSYLAVRDTVQKFDQSYWNDPHFAPMVPLPPPPNWPPPPAHMFVMGNPVPMLAPIPTVLPAIPPPPPPPIPVPPPPPPPYLWGENPHLAAYIEPIDRIFSPNYISRDVAVDVAKAYYHENTFEVTDRCHTRMFRRLLTADRFDLGLDPFSHIRKLRFAVPTKCCWNRRGRRPGHNERNIQEPRCLTQLSRGIAECLDLFPEQILRNMELTFVLTHLAHIAPHGESDERCLVNTLFAIRPSVYRLKHLYGTKVVVTGGGARERLIDFTSLFSKSADVWQQVCSLCILTTTA